MLKDHLASIHVLIDQERGQEVIKIVCVRHRIVHEGRPCYRLRYSPIFSFRPSELNWVSIRLKRQVSV